MYSLVQFSQRICRYIARVRMHGQPWPRRRTSKLVDGARVAAMLSRGSLAGRKRRVLYVCMKHKKPPEAPSSVPTTLKILSDLPVRGIRGVPTTQAAFCATSGVIVPS